jgi:hypothetical protein
MSRSRVAVAFVTTLLAFASAAFAGVSVVDLASPAPVLQAAVDAAADGDILLLKPGSIDLGSTITIDGKGLALIADGVGVPIGRIIVKNLPAGRQVTLRGLTIGKPGQSSTTLHTGALEVRDCVGGIWIEDCVATAQPSPAGTFGGTFTGVSGALVEDSAAVVFLNSRLVGGAGSAEQPSCVIPGYAPASPGGEGLRVTGSTVVMHRGEATGGEGGHDVSSSCPAGFQGEKGGPGMFVQSSIVHVAGASLLGADKTPATSSPGSGLVVADAASSVSLRGSSVLAGIGPPVVDDIVAPPDTVATFTAPPRSVHVTSPRREGQPAQLVIDGQAGDLTALFIAFSGSALVVPGKQGVWALGSPFFGPMLLATNPVGHWVIGFTAGQLTPASLQGQTFLLQLAVHDGSQVLFEGNTTYTLIDSTIP